MESSSASNCDRGTEKSPVPRATHWAFYVLVALAVFSTTCSSKSPSSESIDSVRQAVVSAPPEPQCTSATYGGHEYWFCSRPRGWADAQTHCAAVGTHLVRIEDVGENTFVRATGTFDPWIGAREGNRGEWSWTEGNQLFWTGGKKGVAVGGAYVNWEVDEPDNGAQTECASASSLTGHWTTRPCGQLNRYVCENPVAIGGDPLAPDTACTRGERDGHIYWFCSNSRGADEARHKCQTAGMELATVDNSGENDFVKANVSVASFIGLSDAAREGTWRWHADQRLGWCGDGAGNNSGGYSNWAAAQPPASSCTYETRNGHAYWFCNAPASWETARRACASARMSMVRIDDAGENDFTKAKAPNKFWLGASDSAADGQWRWLAGDALFWTGGNGGQPVGGLFTAWAANNPVNGNVANCAALRGSEWISAACTAAEAFVCEGDIVSDPEIPDARDCASLGASDGRWTAAECAVPTGYVCETIPSDAFKTLDQQAESIRDEYRSGKPRVSDVQMRTDAAVIDPFGRYGERLGLRECVDGLKPEAQGRPLPELGVEAVIYEQTYKGLPVYTRGYLVQRDPVTKVVRSFTGTFQHNLNLDVTPTVSEASAFASAAAAVGALATDYVPPPTGRLILSPKKQGLAPEWELAWLFALPSLATVAGHDVAISAKSGAVLMFGPHIYNQASNNCQSTDVTVPPVAATIEVAAFQQTSPFSDPGTAVGGQLQSGGANPFVLRSVGSPPRSYALCDGETNTNMVVGLPTSKVALTELSGHRELAAGMFVATQRCTEFVADPARGLKDASGGPWIGLDGAGNKPIDIRLRRAFKGQPAEEAFFDPESETLNYNPDRIFDAADGDFLGASIEVACHEYGHGIFHNMVGTPGADVESRSINEGFGDVIGSAAEMHVRKDFSRDSAGWCFRGDDNGNQSDQNGRICGRNFRDPYLSTDEECTFLGPDVLSSKCPRAYGTGDYCAFAKRCNQVGDPFCCGDHRNALVLDRWVYLLSTGDTSIGHDMCPGLNVPTIDTTADKSVMWAARVLHQGLRNHSGSPFGYAALAAATISAAKTLPDGATKASSVDAAWRIVNVTQENANDLTPSVQPPRSAKNIKPWVKFSWPVASTSTSWDFQISNRTFAAPILPTDTNGFLYTKNQITQVEDRNGTLFGILLLGLKANSTDRLFWRVRPSAGSSGWSDCYPIHAFDGTQDVDQVEMLFPDDPTTPEQEVAAGTSNFQWKPVDYAQKYLFQISDQDTGCVAGQGTVVDKFVDTATGMHDGLTMLTEVKGLQPGQAYYFNIRAFGPPTPTTPEKDAEGKCQSIRIRAGGMLPPLLIFPSNQSSMFGYDSPHTTKFGTSVPPTLRWSWLQVSAAESYAVRFYLRNVPGTTDGGDDCSSTTVVHSVDVTSPCVDSLCTLTDDPFPIPNASGYCWDVVAKARNGATATSAKGKFNYILATNSLLSPGVDLARTESNPADQGALEDTSYDKPVILNWSSVPNAASYGVKLGRWPWRFPLPLGSQEPANCLPLDSDGSGFCISGPKPTDPVPITTVVVGQSLPLTSDLGGRGRYCWSVWPRIAGDVQPFVESPNIHCYTTGPAIPRLEFDMGFEPPAAGTPFPTTTPVKGRVIFDYNPLGKPRVDINATLTSSSWTENCERTTTRVAAEWTDGKNWMFGDVYNCEYQFAFIPEADKTYTVNATTFGKNGVAIVKELRSFATKNCGRPNEACCAGDTCPANTSTSCQMKPGGQKACLDCGSASQPCCPSGGTNGPEGCRNGGKCTGTAPNRTCTACQRDTTMACSSSTQCTCPGDKCASFVEDEATRGIFKPHCVEAGLCGVEGFPCCLEPDGLNCPGIGCFSVRPGDSPIAVNLCLRNVPCLNVGDPCCPFFTGKMCLNGLACLGDRCGNALPSGDDAGLTTDNDAGP
jgi:YHS domain-containing protein